MSPVQNPFGDFENEQRCGEDRRLSEMTSESLPNGAVCPSCFVLNMFMLFAIFLLNCLFNKFMVFQ